MLSHYSSLILLLFCFVLAFFSLGEKRHVSCASIGFVDLGSLFFFLRFGFVFVIPLCTKQESHFVQMTCHTWLEE